MLEAGLPRRHELRSRRWCYRIARERSAIGQFADALDADLCAAGLGEASRRQLATVLDELLANVVMHARDGRGHVHVRLQHRHGRMIARLRYRAARFDPTAHVTAEAPTMISAAAIGGAGIALVRALTQAFTYRYRRGENRVCVELAA